MCANTEETKKTLEATQQNLELQNPVTTPSRPNASTASAATTAIAATANVAIEDSGLLPVIETVEMLPHYILHKTAGTQTTIRTVDDILSEKAIHFVEKCDEYISGLEVLIRFHAAAPNPRPRIMTHYNKQLALLKKAKQLMENFQIDELIMLLRIEINASLSDKQSDDMNALKSLEKLVAANLPDFRVFLKNLLAPILPYRGELLKEIQRKHYFYFDQRRNSEGGLYYNLCVVLSNPPPGKYSGSGLKSEFLKPVSELLDLSEKITENVFVIHVEERVYPMFSQKEARNILEKLEKILRELKGKAISLFAELCKKTDALTKLLASELSKEPTVQLNPNIIIPHIHVNLIQVVINYMSEIRKARQEAEKFIAQFYNDATKSKLELMAPLVALKESWVQFTSNEIFKSKTSNEKLKEFLERLQILINDVFQNFMILDLPARQALKKKVIEFLAELDNHGIEKDLVAGLMTQSVPPAPNTATQVAPVQSSTAVTAVSSSSSSSTAAITTKALDNAFTTRTAPEQPSSDNTVPDQHSEPKKRPKVKTRKKPAPETGSSSTTRQPYAATTAVTIERAHEPVPLSEDIDDDSVLKVSDFNVTKAKDRYNQRIAAQIKERSEFVKNLSINEKGKALLANLFSGKFSHDDLLSLCGKATIHESISIHIEYPKGGSSHFTVVINGTTGYIPDCDAEYADTIEAYTVKGKSYVPKKSKLKNSGDLPDHIVFGLQLTFRRAGLTEEVLGITEVASKKTSHGKSTP